MRPAEHVTATEIAAEPEVKAEGAAQVKEPEQVAVVAVEPEPVDEPVMPSPTKPPDRMTRMRQSFRPSGKIAVVADDAVTPAPEGERASGE